ncbi:hypothetical protein CMO91_04290 [Candidatus Woesearchaeota archaeon]|nr:hypothetical protein [Candidatus Woesearchaeota archaeon]
MTDNIILEDVKRIVDGLGTTARQLSDQTILVTGGAGFLGKYLVRTLQHLNKHVLDKPCKIVILDNFITGLRGVLEEDETTQVLEQDISKPFTIEGEIDYIMHAASIAAPLMYSKYPIETIDVGFIGTRNLLEIARDKKVKSMLFFSTSEVYGNPDPKFIPTPETYFGNVSCIGPRAAYDEPKRIGETLCMTYYDQFNTPVNIVRPFNIYGPGMRLDDGRGAINFVVAALKGEKIPVYGDGRNTRTWCYVTDAITGFFQVLLSNQHGEVFNIGSDEQEIEMRHLAEIVAGLVQHQDVSIHNVVGPNEAYSKADVSRRCPDLTKIRSVIGYVPKVNLVKGLTRFVAWADETLKKQATTGNHEKCRICNNDDLQLVLSLGESPLANNLLVHGDLDKKEPVFPLDMVYCPKCHLCQLSYVVPPEEMFTNYLYVTSTTQTFRDHFATMAHHLTEEFNLDEHSLVVDIGSNDGLLLKNFNTKVVGVEPAENLCEIARKDGVETFCGYFSEDIVNSIVQLKGRADLVTANNVFAHIGNIQEVAKNVKNMLKPDGVFVIEVQYVLDTITDLTFDNIYHEHLSYFSVMSLKDFFARQDMGVFKAEHVETHGGSIRVFVQKSGGTRPEHPSVKEFIEKEKIAGLDQFATYAAFGKKIEAIRENIRTFVQQAKQQGKSIVGYGAPAKATTALNFYGITGEDIDYIVEDNPLKHDKIVPGVRIPIKSKEAAAQAPPDYMMILAWNFADEIVKNNEPLRQQGVQFVVPSPEVKIV